MSSHKSLSRLTARLTRSRENTRERFYRLGLAASHPELYKDCFLDDWRAGATTAEYAIVLLAATGFAGVLGAILKSDAVKTMLTETVKKALKIG